jgi:riboflavin biosynthesis RibT protein
MLYKYKNDYEKIAMGLLSFIPDLKEISHLKAEFQWYQGDDSRVLFLWKNEHGDFIGVIGVEVSDEILMVRHIAVSPANRNEGVSFEMLDALIQQYPNHKVMGSMETNGLITKWEQHHAEI